MAIKLPIKRLLYEINAPLELPFQRHFPTVTLRGAFGYSLLQIIARDEAINNQDKVAICKQLFFANDISDKAGHKNSARPFVMRGYYSRPDRKSFILEMLLFGSITTAEILVDNVIKNMCHMGLGNQNMQCDCLKLGSESIIPVIPELSTGSVVINFQTPTRIKSCGKYFEEDIPFRHLFCRLADRLQELIKVFTAHGTELELSELKSYSKEIGMIVNEANYHNISRHSTRTGDECSLSGFTGQILYTGDLQPFAELLAYLPWVNVGSSTAFGCGWCTLEYNRLV